MIYYFARKPIVCGVTQLEKDHLRALGGSVESIAWHKGGIFKVSNYMFKNDLAGYLFLFFFFINYVFCFKFGTLLKLEDLNQAWDT